MAAMQENSFCVLEYARCSSVTAERRAFIKEYRKEPLGHQSILRWYRQFQDTGFLCKQKSTGRPSVSDQTVERVRQSFVHSPQKSTITASRALGIPQQTVWKILRRLQFKPYRLQLLQQLKPEDYGRRLEFFKSKSRYDRRSVGQ
jgi:DNA-binding transcriptional regulator YhcF (GntR family)